MQVLHPNSLYNIIFYNIVYYIILPAFSIGERHPGQGFVVSLITSKHFSASLCAFNAFSARQL